MNRKNTIIKEMNFQKAIRFKLKLRILAIQEEIIEYDKSLNRLQFKLDEMRINK